MNYGMNYGPYLARSHSMPYYGSPYGMPFGSPWASSGTGYMEAAEPFRYPDIPTLQRSMTDSPMITRQSWPVRDPYSPYTFENTGPEPIGNSTSLVPSRRYHPADNPYLASERPKSLADQSFSARKPGKTRFQADKLIRHNEEENDNEIEYTYADELEDMSIKHAPRRRSNSLKTQKKLILEALAQRKADKLKRQTNRVRMPAAPAPPSDERPSEGFTRSRRRTVRKSRNEYDDFERPLHGQGEVRSQRMPSSDYTKASSYSYGTTTSGARGSARRPRPARHVSFEERGVENHVEIVHTRRRSRNESLVPPPPPPPPPPPQQLKSNELPESVEPVGILGLDSSNAPVEDPAQEKAKEYMNERSSQSAQPLNNTIQNSSSLRHLSRRDRLNGSASLRSKRSENEGHGSNQEHSVYSTASENGAIVVKPNHLKMLIDITKGFEAEFDGRLLGIYPVGEGSIAELVISGKKGGQYQSGKVSTIASRSQGKDGSSDEDKDEDDEEEEENDDGEDDHSSTESDTESSSGSSVPVYASGQMSHEGDAEFRPTYVNLDQHGNELFGG
jgi:hypothetical protein